MNVNATLAQLALKNGPWAVGCAVLLAGFYYFALVPMTAERADRRAAEVVERAMLLETLQQGVSTNRETMATIETNTTAVTHSILLQQAVLDKIGTSLAERLATAKESQKVMFAFAEHVAQEHPEQTRLLGELLEEMRKKP